MNLGKFFGKTENEMNDNEETKDDRRIIGKIIHLEENGGWGFITSQEIKFTRIFFHWTALQTDTLHFSDLKKHMKVEFTPKLFEGTKWRAIKIKALPLDGDNNG